MTKEQIQALMAAAENLATAEERYDRAEITIREYISVNDQYHNFVKDPANILSLLAERDADKALIAELKHDVDAANARVDAGCAQLCNQDEEIEMLRQRIDELEDRTLTVKLPKPHAHLIWIQAGYPPDDYWDDVAVSHSVKDRCCDGSERYPVYSIFEIQEACAAAGITLVVGGE